MSDEGDGVSLMSTAHPVAPWHERIYWRAIGVVRWFRDLVPAWRPYETVWVDLVRDEDGRLRVRRVK